MRGRGRWAHVNILVEPRFRLVNVHATAGPGLESSVMLERVSFTQHRVVCVFTRAKLWGI